MLYRAFGGEGRLTVSALCDATLVQMSRISQLQLTAIAATFPDNLIPYRMTDSFKQGQSINTLSDSKEQRLRHGHIHYMPPKTMNVF